MAEKCVHEKFYNLYKIWFTKRVAKYMKTWICQHNIFSYGTKYSGMDQMKFVEDSL